MNVWVQKCWTVYVVMYIDIREPFERRNGGEQGVCLHERDVSWHLWTLEYAV